jgi:hypothetical protein
MTSTPSRTMSAAKRRQPFHLVGIESSVATYVTAANARPGSQSVLNRLSELMFVEVIRMHMDNSGTTAPAGWLDCGIRWSAAR